jgi:hypothetical protein
MTQKKLPPRLAIGFLACRVLRVGIEARAFTVLCQKRTFILKANILNRAMQNHNFFKRLIFVV